MTHTKEPTYPITLFQAAILGHPDVLVKLRAMSLDIMPRPKQRADGRIELRAILKPEQLEPVVAIGATVILERLINPQFPRELIMPRKTALARVRQVVRRVKRRSKSTKGRGYV
jgi:hypothetical protein